jgi:hypothetical protein
VPEAETLPPTITNRPENVRSIGARSQRATKLSGRGVGSAKPVRIATLVVIHDRAAGVAA